MKFQLEPNQDGKAAQTECQYHGLKRGSGVKAAINQRSLQEWHFYLFRVYTLCITGSVLSMRARIGT